MGNSDFHNKAESTQVINVTPISVSNEEISIYCYECNYQCASETLLTLHMKKHRSVSTYQCDKCEFSTSSMDGLLIHKSSDHIEQEILSISRIDVSACAEMLDLSSRKRKFGQCDRSYAKRLKYKLYD